MSSARALLDFWDRLPFIARLLSTAGIALIISGIALLTVTARQDAVETRTDLQANLAAELDTLPTHLADWVAVGDFASLQQTLNRYVTRPLVATVEFHDVGGTILRSKVNDTATIAPAWFISSFDFSEISGSAGVVIGGRNYGEVRLTLSSQRLADRSWQHLKRQMIILMLAIALDFFGIWLVLRKSLAPLTQLEIGANAMANGVLNKQLIPRGSPELRHLAETFNRMGMRLQAAQRDLKRSELFARTIIETSPVGIKLMARDGTLITLNPAYLALVEAESAEEVVGKNVYDLIAPGHRAAFMAFHKRICDGETGDLIYEIIGLKGHHKWMESRATPFVSEAHPGLSHLSFTQDITDRLEAEQTMQKKTNLLADSEQRWELAVSGANDGIWDWNPQTNEVYFSERWKTMLGYRSDEIGANLDEWTSRVHPDDLEGALAELQRHLRGETAFYQCEHRMRCKDGRFIWILDRGRALLDVNGKVVRMSGSHSDVTERRASEEREREHAGQLKAIFVLSPDGFVSFDGDRCVKYVNPAFTRMTSLEARDMVGLNEADFSQRLSLLCLPEAPFPGLAALQAMNVDVSAGRRQVFELDNASKRVIEVGLREAQTGNVSQVLYLRDITHETEVDRMKSEFLSTAAHELRTPMASIYGFAEVLLSQELDAASQREFLTIIHKQSELMASILNELLDLARIEARKGKDFVFEPTPVQALVEQVVQGFKPPAGRSVPTLVATGAQLLMLADHKKAQQAILNVLSNAYKYSPAGGAVQIELLEPAMGLAAAPLVGIRVTDHGIGMTQAQLARVFERFYRADSSGKFLGTGLGMSIVQEIVTLHRGKIDIESAIGQGTTVTLWWPTCRDSQQLSSSPTSTSSP